MLLSSLQDINKPTICSLKKVWYRNYSNNFNLKTLRPQWRSVNLFNNITEQLKGNVCSGILGTSVPRFLMLYIIVTVVIQNETLTSLNLLIVQWTCPAAVIACALACPVCYHGSYWILVSSSDIFYMLLLFRGMQLSHVLTHMTVSLKPVDRTTSHLRIWLIEFRLTATLLIITKYINSRANWVSLVSLVLANLLYAQIEHVLG